MLLLPSLEHKLNFLLKVFDGIGKRFSFAARVYDWHAVIFRVVAIAMCLFENWFVFFCCWDCMLQRLKQALPVSGASTRSITQDLEGRQRKLVSCVI